MAASYSKYLVSTSTTGGKYWEVEVVGTEMRVRYGKLGADRPWSSKSFDTEEKAQKEAEKKANAKMRKGYSEAPRPSAISDEAVDLRQVPLRGVFYFRALDRYPGGNADMFTVKVTLHLAADSAPRFKAAAHSNWDGEHYIIAETDFDMPGLKDHAPELIEAAQALIDAGQRDGAFVINEPRYDRDEYDTEWSFLEFSLYRDDSGSDEEDPLLLKLIQRAQPKAPKVIAPDERSARFMEAVHTLCGIGRVEQHSGALDTFSKTFYKSAKNVSQGYLNAEVPLYL